MIVACRKKNKARDQQADRDSLAHVARNSQSGENEDAPARVEDVIQIESVARALALPDSGERAVQAVAEPVQDKKRDRQP